MSEFTLEAMSRIDPALVEEIDLTGTKKRRLSPALRGGLIAACVCAVLLGTAFAAEVLGVRISNFVGSGENPGYDVSLDGVERVPVDSLPQEIRELGSYEVIEFDDTASAQEALGRELPGFAPFERLYKIKMHFAYGDEATEIDDVQLHHTHCYIKAIDGGEEGGGLKGAVVVAEYSRYEGAYARGQTMDFTVAAFICTAESQEQFNGFGFMGYEGMEMEQRSFTTPDGQEIPIVTTKYPTDWEGKEDGPLADTEFLMNRVSAYFVQDGVLYMVDVHGDRDVERLQAMLESVLRGDEPLLNDR